MKMSYNIFLQLNMHVTNLTSFFCSCFLNCDTYVQVRLNPHCRVAMVNQHHADQLDLSLSPLAFMKRKFPGDGSYNHDQRIRSHLANLGVTSKLMTTPALALSGGQRSRVGSSHSHTH
jgi:ATPase subunit of ABC transporter with duplicated ATPase domains